MILISIAILCCLRQMLHLASSSTAAPHMSTLVRHQLNKCQRIHPLLPSKQTTMARLFSNSATSDSNIATIPSWVMKNTLSISLNVGLKDTLKRSSESIHDLELKKVLASKSLPRSSRKFSMMNLTLISMQDALKKFIENSSKKSLTTSSKVLDSMRDNLMISPLQFPQRKQPLNAVRLFPKRLNKFFLNLKWIIRN